MNAVAVKRPGWFWIVAILALLWNLAGLAMFWMELQMTPEQLAQLPEGQRAVHEAMPKWIWGVDALAVVAGTLGSILLLTGRKLALPVYWVSLVAVVVLFGYCFVVADMIALVGLAQAVTMPLLVTVIAALLVWFARRSIARGWLA